MAISENRHEMPLQDPSHRIRNFNEVALGYDEETALLNRRIFMSDLEECRELTLAEWSRRPWYARLIQSVIRLFAPLL